MLGAGVSQRIWIFLGVWSLVISVMRVAVELELEVKELGDGGVLGMGVISSSR
jgi:hypothetical protein